MESTVAQVKDAIKQLPVQERAVAIALKKIFDQVKELTRKEQEQIDANHISFISKFKVLEKRASQIIQGKQQLNQQDLNTPVKYFTTEQEKQKRALMKQKNGIEHFWLKAVEHSQFGQDLTEQEKQILKAVSDIQTNITTNEIELVISIGKNAFVQAGVYHRRLVLDNGMAISFEGEQPKWISSQEKIDGVLTVYIFANTKAEDQLNLVFSTLGNIVNEVVPYSLEYFLGAGQEADDQQEEDQDGEHNQDDGDDQ